MRCEEAEALLFDYADGRLTEAVRREVEAALEVCPDCQAMLARIRSVERRAASWHDVSPPAWRPPPIRPRPAPGFYQWAPMLASAAALVLAIVTYLERPTGGGAPLNVAPARIPVATEPLELRLARFQDRQTVSQTLLAEALMESTRAQRERELEALVRLLKAEMDRRELAAEESLRYVVAHQIQSQQELDELSSQVQRVAFFSGQGRENPGDTP